MSRAFPSSVRLKERVAFNHVFAAPDRKSSDRYFTVLGRFTLEPQSSRLGLVVAKKQIRRAHERNRIKRLARESFRHSAPQWQEEPPQDMVVIAKHAAELADNQALFRSLSRHWQRLQHPTATP